MRAKIPDLRNQILIDEAVYKRIYMFTYNFARAPAQKSLQLDTAIEYWKLLLATKWKSHLPMWIEFLEKEYKRSVAKDTWNCLWDFVGLCKTDPVLKWYDEEGGFSCPLGGILVEGGGGVGGGWWLWCGIVANTRCVGAWPSILDSFVAYVRKKGGNRMDTS